jgi:sarcosine oxidase subunit beta
MERSAVAVVGAGVSGLSIAWHLAERGVSPVTIYERTGIAAEASGVQPGGVRLQWGTRVNCVMALEAKEFYDDVEERLGARVDLGWRACGYTFLAHSPETLARLGENVALQNELGVPSRIVTPEEAAELVPGLRPDTLAGAAWCGEDGYFDRPQGVVEAFAEAARRSGVAVEHEEVAALARDGEGWRLELARGGRVHADEVVVAAGYGTPALMRTLGVEVPIQKEGRYMFYSEPVRERLLEPLVISPERRFAAKQLGDGRILMSDLGAAGDPDEHRERWRAHVRACVEELVPVLEYVSLPLLVEGWYDMTPDHQAVLGRVPGHNGLWIAAGFSGHGFMMAPATGRSIADAMLGGDEAEWLSILSLDRFARDRLVIEPAVV